MWLANKDPLSPSPSLLPELLRATERVAEPYFLSALLNSRDGRRARRAIRGPREAPIEPWPVLERQAKSSEGSTSRRRAHARRRSGRSGAKGGS